MGEQTRIEWCDHTFNPWIGCEKIAPGCKHCYAAELAAFRGWAEWGGESRGGTRRVASETKWREPLKWNRAAACLGSFDCANGSHSDACPQSHRPRVFCASLADVWEDWRGPLVDAKGRPLWVNSRGGYWEGDDGSPGFAYERRRLTVADVRRRLFELIEATPNLDWLLLTKRPENVRRLWPFAAPFTASDGGPDVIRRRLENVWLGASISDPPTAEQNLRELYALRKLSPVLFASAEPLVESIDFAALTTDPLNSGFALTDGFGFVDGEGPPELDWLIVGGESGADGKRRDCGVDALVDVARQGVAAGVATFVKQDCARKRAKANR